ncbi:MAG: hypothetical protein ACRD2G_11205, partial [Terriglobia bacterium]
LDARNFFETTKGEYRQNQFGATLGGPVTIPHIYNGKNKTWFFLDYEGTRIRQAQPYVSTVPTVEENKSGFTDFSELISGQSGTQLDKNGVLWPKGTIFDPATTQQIGPGTFVRQPFANNQIPANRIDPNVVKLLNLYPAPNAGAPHAIFNNFTSDPMEQDTVDNGGARIDHNFSDRDQVFGRVNFANEPIFKPGPFTGFADGGGFNQGSQTAATNSDVLSWTHSVSPTLINEARIGFSRIGTSRVQPFSSNLTNIPGQYGIQGIPQVPLNGGLPNINIGGLTQMGNAGFLPSVEYNSTVQATENLTKVYNAHTFKGGFEFQHVKFSTLQPPFSRGSFNFNGTFSEVPTFTNGSTGMVDVLLIPTAATVPNGFNNVGGSSGINASNISNTDDGKQYYGLYFQDDWKTTQKLTLNLGVRWDYFGQVYEMFGGQANFIPGDPGQALYLIPYQRCNRGDISPSFQQTTAAMGIQIKCSGNQSLGNSQLTNFSPRVGFAYQLKPKLVVRGGYGWFYDGFENRGYSPNIGENYPFQFQFAFNPPDPAHPIVFSNGTLGTLGNGFNGIPLSPTLVQAHGLNLEGIQYNYITPYTMGYNLTVQYQFTPNQTFQVGYVGNSSRHLETFVGSNRDSVIVPNGINRLNYAPFPDFGYGQSYAATEGNSFYNSVQATYERRFSGGLNMVADYTYSKCMNDTRDLLNNNQQGFRAPYLPHFGIQADYSYCDSDTRNLVHFSGTYQLPFGKGKALARNASGVANAVIGGWNANWILTLEDGQPFGVGCPQGTTSGFGCNAFLVPGQSMISGQHDVNQWLNPAAFAQPPLATAVGQTDYSVLGGAPTQAMGPGFHRLDFSLFKEFQITESAHLEFRTEVFNITNTPQFALPGSKDFTNPQQFTKITGTRDGASDPREIQLALKLYW